MVNNLDEKDIFRLITQLEVKHKDEIKRFGHEAWPIVRIAIINFFQNKQISNNKIQKNSLINSFSNLLNKIKVILSQISIINNFYSKEILESKNIFFSRSHFLDKLNSGKLFDRIIDPFYLTSSANIKSSKFYLDNKFLKFNLFAKGYFYKRNKFLMFLPKFSNKKIRNLEYECTYFMKLFIKETNQESIKQFLLKNSKDTLRSYLNAKHNAKKFLKKFKYLKKVYVSSWYAPDAMGLIAAAYELKIQTIDIQHGKQGKYQAAYCGWNSIPENGFVNLPRFFWCWGEKSFNDILGDQQERVHHMPVIVSYPWPIWYQTFISRKVFEKNKVKVRLLFTMQWKKGNTIKEPLEDGLLELIKFFDYKFKALNQKEFHLLIRIHPQKIKESLFYLKERLGKLYYSEIISYSSNTDNCLFDDLAWANHHLTNFSSCAIESLYFDLKSAVYGNLAHEIYKEEIQNNALFFLKDCNKEELLNWIKDNDNKEKRISTKYISKKLPNPNLFTN